MAATAATAATAPTGCAWVCEFSSDQSVETAEPMGRRGPIRDGSESFPIRLVSRSFGREGKGLWLWLLAVGLLPMAHFSVPELNRSGIQ